MNFIRKIATLLYVLLMIAVGAGFILFSWNILPKERLIEALDMINAIPALQITFSAVGGFFVLLGILAPYRLAKALSGARVIAFQNSEGEVTVSLSAIEDYIRKIGRNIVGIKDVRSRVAVSKKGVEIKVSAAVAASANIPEVTERLQMEIKNKVQNMLGMEEKINVLLHIRNITKGIGEPEEAAPIEERIPYR